MKKIRIIQRYKCDFCQRRSIKHVIALHEKRCYRNPDRFCDYCQNRGFTVNFPDPSEPAIPEDCPYCKGFNKEMLIAIEEDEKEEKLPWEIWNKQRKNS